MDNSRRNRAPNEIERLRNALDAETRARLDMQRQVDRANADFEEFISMTAHNLRESLRDVASFSKLMAESYAGRLDSDAGEFLGRIQLGAARMQSLLSSVVDYWAGWATDTGGRELIRSDMEAVLCQALLCTDKQIREARAIVTHDPLPAVTGDFELLTKVLHHLIRNAIEYCEAPPARVHISSRPDDISSRPDDISSRPDDAAGWVFSVQDNGPGIDPALSHRIFGVFKRLHGPEFPGNGLGLAFCKKAIEWQGGRIWMESTPGEGSTFYFTLPPAD
jgi:light-regulated signal transduction histidine kinase (bacteriophytochrome)